MHVVIQGNIKALLRCFAIEYLGKQKKNGTSIPAPISTRANTQIPLQTYQHKSAYKDSCVHISALANKHGPLHAHILVHVNIHQLPDPLKQP